MKHQPAARYLVCAAGPARPPAKCPQRQGNGQLKDPPMGHGRAQEWESGLEAAAPARVTSGRPRSLRAMGGISSDENANRGRQHAAAFARFRRYLFEDSSSHNGHPVWTETHKELAEVAPRTTRCARHPRRKAGQTTGRPLDVSAAKDTRWAVSCRRYTI